MAMGQTGRLFPPSANPIFNPKQSTLLEKHQDEDWC